MAGRLRGEPNRPGQAPALQVGGHWLERETTLTAAKVLLVQRRYRQSRLAKLPKPGLLKTRDLSENQKASLNVFPIAEFHCEPDLEAQRKDGLRTN